MLLYNDGKKRFFERVGLALQGAKTVAEDIEILRCKSYKAAAAEAGGKIVVGLFIAFYDLLRPSLQTVLADHYRTPLAFFEVSGQKQDAIGYHIGPHVQHHFVAPPLRLVVGQAGARSEGQARIGKAANHLVVKKGAIACNGRFKTSRGTDVEPGKKIAAHGGTLAQQPLIVIVQLTKLPRLPRIRIDAPQQRRSLFCRGDWRVQSERPEKGLEGPVRTRRPGAVAAGHQL